MTILVTGGCGFVGSAICRGLVAHLPGCRVTVLDNLRRQGAETNREPLESLGVSVVHVDVRMQSDIDALGPFDWLIDAAAEPSVLAGTSAGTAAGSATTPRQFASEALALEYGHRYGTPCIIDRCGVMAGAGQFGRADQGIFSWWIRHWLAGRPLAYIGFGGRGLQVRDCLHPDDLVTLLVAQIASPPPALEIFAEIATGSVISSPGGPRRC